MADVGLRDLGSFVPGERTRAREPVAPPVPPRAAGAPEPVVLVTPPPAAAPRMNFAGDTPEGRDSLGIDPVLAQLAELAAHKGTAGPLCIGLLGGAGSGKSFALKRLAGRIRDLAGAAAGAGQGSGSSPFHARIHVQSIDAASLEGDLALAVAARLHAGLRQPYPALALEVGAMARDPHAALREANERLDEARRRLDAERRALDDAGSRRARLTETVLYDSAGSQVDAYARANRASIESRFAGFGIHGDPVRAYKDHVQVVAGQGGTTGLALRSLWAFKGQGKLIVAALVLVAIGLGLGIALDDQDSWLGQLRGMPKGGGATADWASAHIGWLATAKTAAYGLAALALVANVLRAIGFLRPILKGARLLDADLDARRRDLDGLYAHQTKRVDTLEADVARLTKAVTEAERRAGDGAGHEPSLVEANGAAQAQAIFAALAAGMAGPAGEGPQRIVLALDHLDAVAPERARAVLDALHRAAGPGIVTLAGVDPARLAGPGGIEAVERWIQVPVRLDAIGGRDAYGALVRDAIGHSARDITLEQLDARRSNLDAPVEDEEAAMLGALADLAGRTPRAVKRFANLYLLARHGEERKLGALAFMLALGQGGSTEERAIVAAALAGQTDVRFDLEGAGSASDNRRLRAALDAVVAVGGRFTTGEAREEARRAAVFTLAPSALV